MKVYGPKDRFKISIEKSGVSFTLSPLTAKQKGEILACTKNAGGMQIRDGWEMARLALRFSVKGWDGFEDGDGKALEARLDPDGYLSEESLDILLNIGEGQGVLISAAMQFATASVPDAVVNADTGLPYEGVSIVHAGKA